MSYFIVIMKNNKIDQLRLSRFALAAIGAMTLGACGKIEETASQPVDESPKVLTVYTWEEYFDLETLEAFEKKSGAKVVYATFENSDEMEAKLKSEPGKYDVIVADDSVLDRMWELKLIATLDHAKLPNLKNVSKDFLDVPHVDPGNEFSAPYTWGTTLVAYRTDKISEPEQSWGLLFDERVKGRVMMYNERREATSIPLIYFGHALNSEDPAHFEAARDLLVKQVDELHVRFGNDTAVREGLTDGSVWAAMCYSGDALRVADECEHVDFFIPEEGAPLWMDSYAITRDTTDGDLAHAFLDHMLDAKMAAMNINYAYYASPNKAAEEFIDKELLANEAINPSKEVLKRCRWYVKMNAERERMMNNVWQDVLRRERALDRVASSASGEPE